MEADDLFTCCQGPPIAPYPEPNYPAYTTPNNLSKIHLVIHSLTSCSSLWSFLPDFPPIPYTQSSFLVRVTSPANLIFNSQIILIIPAYVYKLWNLIRNCCPDVDILHFVCVSQNAAALPSGLFPVPLAYHSSISSCATIQLKLTN
jgi:hypothetical protein